MLFGRNTSRSGSKHGYDYVDLKLPSGTLWATCNIGANKPEEFGYFYAWGENNIKFAYNWQSYMHGKYKELTKYCNKPSFGRHGLVDNITTLQACDDAATTRWGRGWHIPTKKQWDELYQNTRGKIVVQNDVLGWIFTAANGKTLFLPEASYEEYRCGSYWSSTLFGEEPIFAYYFHFYYGGSYYGDRCMMVEHGLRFEGKSIRPVYEK